MLYLIAALLMASAVYSLAMGSGGLFALAVVAVSLAAEALFYWPYRRTRAAILAHGDPRPA